MSESRELRGGYVGRRDAAPFLLEPTVMKLPICSLLLVAALGGTTACDSLGGSCTLIGCIDSFSIELTRATGPFAPGSYDITVDASGSPVTFACTVGEQLQLSRCERPENAPPELSVQPVLGASAVESFFVQVQGTPTEVVLEIDIDGVPALERTFSPSYVTSRPNGPDCGPVCRSADEAIEL